MGNLMSSCFDPKVEKKKRSRASLSKRFSNPPPLGGGGGGGIGSSNRFSKIRSSRKDRHEEALIQEQALAAAALLLQHQQQNGGSGLGGLPFDRSASLRYPAPGPKKQALPRSSSSRSRSLTDPLLQPQELVNQDLNIDTLETNHFVLVHGGGFGAWCWYRTIALLEEGGFKVDAIDLTGSGIHSFDTNNIKTLSQYVKPLTDFLEKLDEGQKVILVGHDFGGTCISYAMEEFPLKVAKAIFISAAMLRNGQSTLDMFSLQPGLNELMLAAQKMLYANGTDCPPTAIDLDKGFLGELFFNRSPTKDVALASVSLRPIPFAPILEKLSLTDGRYGSLRRFYIETSEDNALPLPLQQSMINANPPERVFRLKGGDHAPFFSKPQALHKLLVEIAKIPLAPARLSISLLRRYPIRVEDLCCIQRMGRGVSYGGGQSSLGYLFGSGEAPKPATDAPNPAPAENNGPTNKAQPADRAKEVPAGIQGNLANNYFRADGQNSGNFITDRPSTKVHAAPGGGSSLGYLFGDGGASGK